MKTKTTLDTISDQSEWLASKRTQQIPGKDVEKREPSNTIGGNVN